MERLGPYELLGTLGEGGMGTVYRARIGEVERAVKVLHGDSWNAKSLARFEREVANLARLSHPNVVRIHDTGVEQGRPFFAMDLVEGRSLTDVLAAGRLDRAEALELAIQLARGVEALHAGGIVHRDLKPDNVMVTADGRAVVLDLGLAVAPGQDERLTQTGTMLGTLSYMSPEQVAGRKDAHPHTDVYALGLILFELVTGISSVPEASSRLELIGKIMHQTRPPPSAVDGSLPVALDRVFVRSTAREGSDRYPDAGAFAQAVEAVRRRPGISRRSARRRLGVALATIVAAALALAAWPRDAAVEGPAEVTTDTTTGRSAAQLALAERRLAELRSLRDPHERVRSATAWLERYGELPAAPDVRALREAAQRAFPLRVLTHPGDAQGWFLAGERALTIGSDKTARVWDLNEGSEVHRVDLSVVPTAAAVPPDRKSFVVQSKKKAFVWVDARGRQLGVVRHPWERPLCLSANRKNEVAIGGLSEWAHVLLLETGKERLPLGMQLSPTVGIAYTFDERSIVTITGADPTNPNPNRGLDNLVRVYEGESGLLLWSIVLPHRPTCVASALNRSAVVVGDEAGNLFDVDVHSQAAGGEYGPDAAHSGPVGGVALSPDGRRLYSAGGRPGRTELVEWDVPLREALRRVELAGAARSVDVSADGRRVLVGTAAGRVELWLAAPAR